LFYKFNKFREEFIFNYNALLLDKTDMGTQKTDMGTQKDRFFTPGFGSSGDEI